MIDAIHQSMVNMWLRCGVQFEYRYIHEEVIPPGVAARRGSSFHKTVNTNHRQMIASGKPMPLDELKDATRDEYVRLVKDEGVFIAPEKGEDVKKMLNDGLNQSLNSIEVYQQEILPTIKPVESEKSIMTDIGLTLPLAGTIDLIVPRNVKDFKLHGRTMGQKWADNELQPGFYYELYRELYGVYPDSFQYEEIVSLKTKTNHNMYETKRDESDLVKLRRYISSFIRDLQTGSFRPAEPNHWICSPEWCGYYKICKYRGG